MSGGFDRVRPRTPDVEPSAAGAAGSVGNDAEGKRALFSSAAATAKTGIGSVVVECSRCGTRTVLGPGQALRTMLPSLHLALRVGRRDDVRVLGMRGRDFPSYARCPACRRPSWTRVTVQL